MDDDGTDAGAEPVTKSAVDIAGHATESASTAKAIR